MLCSFITKNFTKIFMHSEVRKNLLVPIPYCKTALCQNFLNNTSTYLCSIMGVYLFYRTMYLYVCFVYVNDKRQTIVEIRSKTFWVYLEVESWMAADPHISTTYSTIKIIIYCHICISVWVFEEYLCLLIALMFLIFEETKFEVSISCPVLQILAYYLLRCCCNPRQFVSKRFGLWV